MVDARAAWLVLVVGAAGLAAALVFDARWLAGIVMGLAVGAMFVHAVLHRRGRRRGRF